MKVSELIVLGRMHPGHLPVFLAGRQINGVDILGGRIRRDVMGDSFDELPNSARDSVITFRFDARDDKGSLPGLRLRELIDILEGFDAEDEVFILGAPVDGYERSSGRIANERGVRRFLPNNAGGKEEVVRFTHWVELSDGTRHLLPF